VAWPTEHVVLPRSQAQVRSVLQTHGKGHWGPIPLSPSLTLVVEKLAKTGIMSVGQMHSYNFWYTHSGLGTRSTTNQDGVPSAQAEDTASVGLPS
jgi:hypothetical protein